MPIIKNILHSLLNVQDDWRLQLLEVWPEIVGSLQTRIRLEKVYEDSLLIGVYESHWMQELFLLSRVLISSINKRLPQPYVKQIKFKLIEQTEHILHEKKQEESVLVYTPRDLTDQEKEMLTSIEDDHLREAMQAYYMRCLQRVQA